jgi:hypothetical protein
MKKWGVINGVKRDDFVIKHQYNQLEFFDEIFHSVLPHMCHTHTTKAYSAVYQYCILQLLPFDLHWCYSSTVGHAYRFVVDEKRWGDWMHPYHASCPSLFGQKASLIFFSLLTAS